MLACVLTTAEITYPKRPQIAQVGFKNDPQFGKPRFDEVSNIPLKAKTSDSLVLLNGVRRMGFSMEPTKRKKWKEKKVFFQFEKNVKGFFRCNEN